jgi:TolB-like protein
VLPFANLSGESEDEHLCDGIADDIITNLSKTPKLLVIASNSSFTYKGKPVKVHQVSKELGVRYVLEGSLIRSGDRVRVSAQLINAMTGHHVWAERYDRVLEDVLSLQDDITKQIIVALQVQLTEGEQAALFAKGTRNFQAYMKYVEGYQLWNKVESKETNAKARQLFEEVVALDPNFILGYTKIAWAHFVDAWLAFTETPEKSLALAEKMARKSIALDEFAPLAHVALGSVLLMRGQYDEGVAEAKRGYELAPGSSDVTAGYPWTLQMAGRYEDALEYSKRMLTLNPFPPVGHLQDLAFQYLMVGMYEDSIAECKRMIRLEPDNLYAHQILSANYNLSGRDDKARAEAAEILRINPTYSQDAFEQAFVAGYKDKASVQRFVDALRKAGLK